ncbi:hypothetical protein [Streptomyces sp. NPDC090025]|uniref:COG1470 family protein n=1 Tax=Streptomyces sp. NPDC090025 TaxID=3365922 RepID=UPI003835D596
MRAAPAAPATRAVRRARAAHRTAKGPAPALGLCGAFTGLAALALAAAPGPVAHAATPRAATPTATTAVTAKPPARATAAPPSPATAATATTAWSAAPAAGRPYVYLEGAAGSVLEDTLSVTNPGPKPLTVRLTGRGAPVAFAARTVTVPARTRADVPFAVTVTAGTPPGDHQGSVRASAGGRESVIPLHLRVGGPRLAALTVEDVRVERSGTLRYTLVNRGNTVLAPTLAVRADGLLGTVLDRPSHALPLALRPGERVTRTEPWPDPPALDSVTVRLTADAPGAATATARADASFASPAGLGALTAALLAAAGATTYALRRRKR